MHAGPSRLTNWRMRASHCETRVSEARSKVLAAWRKSNLRDRRQGRPSSTASEVRDPLHAC